jgi:hypothetical protein
MEKKKHYMLYSDHSGLNGVPIFLDARLWERIDNKKDLMSSVSENTEWDCWYEYRKEVFPDKLFFIAKAPKLSFDYYPLGSGLIVSEEFLDFLKKNTDNFSFVPLKVYSNKMKVITSKSYFFLKFNSYLIDGFDYENSKYTPNIADNGKVMLMNNHPWIASVEELVLNKAVTKDVDIFCLHGWKFFNKPFISEKLLKEALNKKFHGIRYIEVNKLVDFFANHCYLNKGNIVVE